MNESDGARVLTGETLLKQGLSLKVLAITVILMLSVGVVVIGYPTWQGTGFFSGVLEGQRETLVGFAFLMLLTVGYLVGKGWATTRYQGVLIERLMQEEAVARALQLDPIMEFHHPEVCREVLLRQANYAGRVNSPVSLVEMTVPELTKLWMDRETRPAMGEFFREIKRNCRALDFWVRWTPNSLLLVLLDVQEEEVAGVVYRLRARLEKWWEQQAGMSTSPQIEWRYLTAGRLGTSGDILQEVRNLLEPERFVPTPMAGVWQAKEPVAAAARPRVF